MTEKQFVDAMCGLLMETDPENPDSENARRRKQKPPPIPTIGPMGKHTIYNVPKAIDYRFYNNPFKIKDDVEVAGLLLQLNKLV